MCKCTIKLAGLHFHRHCHILSTLLFTILATFQYTCSVLAFSRQYKLLWDCSTSRTPLVVGPKPQSSTHTHAHNIHAHTTYTHTGVRTRAHTHTHTHTHGDAVYYSIPPGFNVETVEHKGTLLTFWDLAGQEKVVRDHGDGLRGTGLFPWLLGEYS